MLRKNDEQNNNKIKNGIAIQWLIEIALKPNQFGVRWNKPSDYHEKINVI